MADTASTATGRPKREMWACSCGWRSWWGRHVENTACSWYQA